MKLIKAVALAGLMLALAGCNRLHRSDALMAQVGAVSNTGATIPIGASKIDHVPLPSASASATSDLPVPLTIELGTSTLAPQTVQPQLAPSGCTSGYSGNLPVPGFSGVTLSIAAPPGCALGFLLYMHGGGWTGGSKDDGAGFQGPLNALGIVYATLDYTLGAPMGIMVAEVGAAYNLVQTYASYLGIDPYKMGLFGISAGGQLAEIGGIVAAAQGHPVRFIGGLFAPPDLSSLESFFCSTPGYGQLCGTLFSIMGGFPQTVPASYIAYSPIDNYAALAGAPVKPSVYLAHAQLDLLVPIGAVDRFSADLRSIGIPTTYDRVYGNDIGHGVDANLANYLYLRAIAFANAALSAPMSQANSKPIRRTGIVQISRGARGEAEAGVFRATSSGLQGVNTFNLGNTYDTGVFLAGDWNGDGQQDVFQIFPGAQGEVEASVFRNTAPGFQGVNTFNLGNAYTGSFLAGDWDGDGRTDLFQVFQGAKGEVEVSVFRSTASGFQGVNTFNLGNAYTGTFLAGDWDGDGRTDLFQVFQGAKGEVEVSVFRSTSSGFQGVNTFNLGNAYTGTFLAGDWDGDGRSDLFQAFQGPKGEVEVSLFQSTPSGFRGVNTFSLGNAYTGWFLPSFLTNP